MQELYFSNQSKGEMYTTLKNQKYSLISTQKIESNRTQGLGAYIPALPILERGSLPRQG